MLQKSYLNTIKVKFRVQEHEELKISSDLAGGGDNHDFFFSVKGLQPRFLQLECGACELTFVSERGIL